MNTPQQPDHEQKPKPDKLVTIRVNEHDVSMEKEKATGLEIKTAAMVQGVAIQLDFSLFRVVGQGQLKQVDDHKETPIHDGEQFDAVAPDDNSGGMPRDQRG